MDETKRIKVLIVDDFPVVRAGLRNLIEREADLRVAAEAADGCEAVEIFRARQPDVVLMDLRMPLMNGLEATRRICAGGGRVIVLTGSGGHEAARRTLAAGAKAYLLKTAAPDEIIAAIRRVAAGKKYLPAALRERLAEQAAAESLTTREMQILELIVRGSSNREIAARLDVTEGTVKGHVNRLLGKLGVADRTQAALAAVGRGIFLWTENETAEIFSRL